MTITVPVDDDYILGVALINSRGLQLGGSETPLIVGNFYHDVAGSKVDGHSIIHKFGRNPDIDIASGFEAIWNGGDSYTGFNATVAETVTVVSTSALDMVTTGTGAWTVKLFGLDANYVEQTETINLNGTTPVVSTLLFLRMDRMRILTAGIGAGNAGSITCAQSITVANIFAVMPIGYNSTMIAAYTVPAGKTGHMSSWFAGLSGKTNANCNVKLRAKALGEVFQVQEEISVQGSGSSLSPRLYPLPKGPFAAKTDIFIEADTDSNNTGFAAGFDMILVEDGF